MQAILHVADYNAPYSGNFVSEIRAIARASKSRLGLRSAIAFPLAAERREWTRMLQDDGVEVFFIPNPHNFLSVTKTLASIVSSNDVVILHCHFNRRYEVASSMCRVLNPAQRIDLIWHRRSDGPFQPKLLTRIKNYLCNRVLASDVRVIALSNELRNQAILTGIRSDRVSTMFNGIDTNRATSPNRGREEVRRAWGASVNTRVFLHFGWDPITKGVDLLLKAAMQVLERNKLAMIVIVGWDATIAAANEVLGGHSPSWLRIVPPVESVADLYQAADFLLSTSRYEGFPGCVAEGMAAGLPVLATDIPGVRWASASSGVRFVDLEVGSIAAGLEFMLKITSTELIDWSRANRAVIEGKYTAECLADEVSVLYSSVLDRRASSPRIAVEGRA